jgi:KDO2-lipid IV(A) lauroyltransferase
MDAVSWSFGQIARAVGPLTRAHRTAVIGLRIAFPEMTDADRERLARDQWENFGRYIGEFPLVDRITPERGRVEIEGFERLRAIALSGKPAILISGHFSNIEVMAAAILSAGIVCDVTYRAANNPLVDARIIEGRARYGVRLFAPKGADGARSLLTSLAAGRSIAILNDQKYDGGSAGVFFGQPVRTNPAAARLARKYGAVIQPMSVRRTRGARFRVVVHEPIVVARTEDRVADVDRGVDAINAFIEARVRERPQEWWWMHRRWPAEVYKAAGKPV